MNDISLDKKLIEKIEDVIEDHAEKGINPFILLHSINYILFNCIFLFLEDIDPTYRKSFINKFMNLSKELILSRIDDIEKDKENEMDKH